MRGLGLVARAPTTVAPWLALAGALLAVALVGAALASGPALAAEQEPTAAPASEGGILLNFRDASLDAVLDFLSEAAGFIVVKDAAVQGRVSVVSRQPMTPDEAVGLLNTVLKDRGYAAVQTGRVLRIVPLEQAKLANLPVRSGSDPNDIEPSDRLVTQVIPLRSVDAVKLRDNLASLLPPYAELSANASSNSLILTDTEANVRRVLEIVRALDRHLAASVDVRVFQLKYASATNVARLINEVFQQEQAAQQGTGPMAAFRRFGPPMPGQEEATPEAGRAQRVTAAGDDRTNTVAVSGPPDVLEVVARVITQLDSNPAAEQGVFTYRLKNAQAINLATVLNTLFSQQYTTTQAAAARTGSGGGPGAAQRAAQQGAGAVSQTVADLAGRVYVVADEDTNSLLVMTASGNFARVRAIIAELDQPVPQVLIKVLIAEVTHSRERDLGVEFSALNLDEAGSSVVTDFDVAAQTAGLVARRVRQDLEVVLRALDTVGRLEVLSRPYILASDQQESTITVGSQVPHHRDRSDHQHHPVRGHRDHPQGDSAHQPRRTGHPGCGAGGVHADRPDRAHLRDRVGPGVRQALRPEPGRRAGRSDNRHRRSHGGQQDREHAQGASPGRPPLARKFLPPQHHRQVEDRAADLPDPPRRRRRLRPAGPHRAGTEREPARPGSRRPRCLSAAYGGLGGR